MRLDSGEVVRALRTAAGAVAAGVRPEKISIGARGGENQLQGTVAETAFLGIATQVVVRTTAGTVQVFAQNIDPARAFRGAGCR